MIAHISNLALVSRRRRVVQKMTQRDWEDAWTSVQILWAFLFLTAMGLGISTAHQCCGINLVYLVFKTVEVVIAPNMNERGLSLWILRSLNLFLIVASVVVYAPYGRAYATTDRLCSLIGWMAGLLCNSFVIVGRRFPDAVGMATEKKKD